MTKKPPIDFSTQLKAVPVKNSRAKIEKHPDNYRALAATVKLDYSGYKATLSRILGVKPRKTRTYEIVGLSRELFDRMDGKTAIEDLIDYLMAEHKLTFFEARGIILKYTHDLMQRGLIAVAGE